MLSPIKIIFLAIAAWFIVRGLKSTTLPFKNPLDAPEPNLHPWYAEQYSRKNGFYRAKEQGGRWYPYPYSYWW